MQKKIIALAVAALASGAALAQSNVQIYGIMDIGHVQTFSANDGVSSRARTALQSGVSTGSRLGFRGSEDLGNGLKVIFEVETGLNIDQNTQNSSGTATTNNSAGGLFSSNRHSYVGLTGGFGTVVAGRLDGVRYANYGKYDQSGNGTVTNMASLVNQTDRADNAIAYISPKFSGFSATLAYSKNAGLTGLGNGNDEAAGNVNDGRLVTTQLNYDNGPFSASIDHEELKQQTLANPLEYKTSNVGATYDFGVVKVGAFFDKNTLDNNTTRLADYNVTILSISAPIGGKTKVYANYGRVNDKTAADQDAKKFGIGATYALSKRTNLYADFAKVNNDSNGLYSISYLGNGNAYTVPGLQTATTSTYGTKAMDFGIKHTF